MKMGLCLLLHEAELTPEGQQQGPSSQVPLSFRLKTLHRSRTYSLDRGFNNVVNSRIFGIWLQIGRHTCFNLVCRSYLGHHHSQDLGTVVSWPQVGRESVPRHRKSVWVRSQVYHSGRIGAHWLGLLGPEFHADRLTNGIRGSQTRRSLAMRS